MKQLEAIKKRIALATPGPWVGDEYEMTAPKAPTLNRENIKLVWADDYHMNEWDADFIKNSRTDIEKLVQAVEVMREALENIAAQGQFALNKNELRAFEICAGLAEEALK